MHFTLPLAFLLAALAGPDVSPADLGRFPPKQAVRSSRDLAAYHLQWIGKRIRAIRPHANEMTGITDGGDHEFYGSRWEVEEERRTARAWLREYREWWKDQGARFLAWDDLADAHGCGSWSGLGPPDRETVLFRLRSLRRRIGQEAYAAGRMPCPVPLGRFALLR